ncbi:MAG: RraA family protein [Rhodovibrionaceae bacterium]
MKNAVEVFNKFGTGDLCNAHPEVRALGAAIKPLYPGIKLIGPAKTARMSPGQNAAIHLAVHTSQPGDVLVVDGGGTRGFGPFGDILATGCQKKQIAGLVIDSTIRDAGALREMQFPVFCLGSNPTGTVKTEVPEVDIEILCGDAPVKPGDLIFGDDDGVVVIPQALAAEVAEKAAAVQAREKGFLERLAAGETTYEIFKLGG